MQSPSTLEMESLVGTTIHPIAEIGRIRAEWEIVDLMRGTCTTQVYLFPDEAGTEPESQPRYWCHTSRVSLDDGSATMLENDVWQSSETKNTRIRSKSTPPRLRGDAKPYMLRRAISLESVQLPLTALSGLGPSLPTPLAYDSNASRLILDHSSKTAPLITSTVHIASLLDTDMAYISIPKSPRSKHISAFETLRRESDLRLEIDAPRELIGFSKNLALAKKQKLPNPYVIITRESDCFQFSAKYTAMPLYWITVEPQTRNGAKISNKSQAVGPYRSAAIWEFVGHTFAKHERLKRLKYKNRRTIMRKFLGRPTPPSRLSQQVPADNNENDTYEFDDVKSAWTDFINSADDVLDTFNLSPRGSPHNTDLGRWQQEDRRGVRRSRGYDLYANEQVIPISSYLNAGLAYDCEEFPGTEGRSNKEHAEEMGLGLSLW